MIVNRHDKLIALQDYLYWFRRSITRQRIKRGYSKDEVRVCIDRLLNIIERMEKK